MKRAQESTCGASAEKQSNSSLDPVLRAVDRTHCASLCVCSRSHITSVYQNMFLGTGSSRYRIGATCSHDGHPCVQCCHQTHCTSPCRNVYQQRASDPFSICEVRAARALRGSSSSKYITTDCPAEPATHCMAQLATCANNAPYVAQEPSNNLYSMPEAPKLTESAIEGESVACLCA